MPCPSFDRRWTAAIFGSLTLLSTAQADGRITTPSTPLPAYVQECAACHIAYPPGLLPAPAWRRIVQGLDDHYGSNASLDPAIARAIGDWLQAHAATGARQAESPPQDRITRAAWFQREHRHLDASVWALPSVKSPAHCGACHTGAEHGDFDEDTLRQPAGLDARQRRSWHD